MFLMKLVSFDVLRIWSLNSCGYGAELQVEVVMAVGEEESYFSRSRFSFIPSWLAIRTFS